MISSSHHRPRPPTPPHCSSAFRSRRYRARPSRVRVRPLAQGRGLGSAGPLHRGARAPARKPPARRRADELGWPRSAPMDDVLTLEGVSRLLAVEPTSSSRSRSAAGYPGGASADRGLRAQRRAQLARRRRLAAGAGRPVGFVVDAVDSDRDRAHRPRRTPGTTSTRESCSTADHLPRIADRRPGRQRRRRAAAHLESADPAKDILSYINSPGGMIYSGNSCRSSTR